MYDEFNTTLKIALSSSLLIIVIIVLFYYSILNKCVSTTQVLCDSHNVSV